MQNDIISTMPNYQPTICMVVDNEFYGDIRVRNEASILTSHGFKVIIICLDFGNKIHRETENGTEVIRIKLNQKLKNILFGIVNTIPLYNWFWQYQIKKLLKNLKVDALHAHDLYMAKPVGQVARSKNIPLVVDLHENYPEAIKNYRWANKFPYNWFAKPAKWEKLERKFLQLANGIIVLSDHFADQIQKKYPTISDEMLWVYPNVPNVDEMLSYSAVKTNLEPDSYFNLLYFGGISERRGIITCINALELIVKTHSNIRLILIGPIDGHERNLFEKAMGNKTVKNNIVYIPWIDISELPSYVHDCHACLSPIRKNAQHESGVANKVFQYMLLGSPLIVSNCKPQEQIVSEGNCGLVFESDNENDLANKIMKLYSNKPLQQMLGKNGNKLATEKYNTTFYGQKLANSYNLLLNKRSG